VDVIAAGDIAERFAPVAVTNPFGPLVRGELEGLPKFRPRAFARSSQQTLRWRKQDLRFFRPTRVFSCQEYGVLIMVKKTMGDGAALL
jgi:hypothetical protein